jgi:uncharacterized protein YeaO (DUF488 family)
MTRRSAFALKRVYDPPADEDGRRVLVDRLWPRGVAKDKARIDLWLKAIAPSDALRKKVHGDPAAWPQFLEAYAAELAEAPAADSVRELRALAAKGRVTLLFASKNAERNNALALKMWLDGDD